MYGIVPQGCIGLGEALDLIATAIKVSGWRGWTREVHIFHRALILAPGDQQVGNEDALPAVIEDSQQIRNVIVHAMGLFYGTPPLHENAVPTLVIDGDGNSIPIPVAEWRRRGTLQLFVRRRWSPRHGDPAFEIFVRRRELEEALTHGMPLESLQPKDASQGEVPTRGKRTNQRRGKALGDYWEHLLSLFKHWRDHTPGVFNDGGSQKSARRLAKEVRTAWRNRARPLPQSPLPLPSLPRSESALRNAVTKALQKLVDESAPQ